jgi:hypothetical protein
MNEEWEDTTLGEVAAFTNGFAFKPEHLSGSHLPVIRIKQLLDESAEVDYTDVEVPERNIIDDGDLIFSWSGTLASRFWNRGRAALNQHLFRVTANEGSDLGWVHLALDYAVEDLLTKSHGTTMKHITKKVLENHEVIRPPLPVQRRIVDLMSHLDAHIANLRAEGDSLLRARNAARETLTSAWPHRSLYDLCEISAPLVDPRSAEYSGLMHIGIERMEKDGGRLLSLSTARDERLKSAKYLFGPADVVFSKIRPNLRKVVTPRFVGLCSADAYPLTPRDGIPPPLLREVLLLPNVTEQIVGKSGRTKMPKVNRRELMEVEVPLCDDESQRSEVAETLDALVDGAERVRVEVESLSAIRDTILAGLLARSLEIDAAYDALLQEVA